MRAATAGGCSWLFVPGDRPERFAAAAGSGADEVICDLEDSVRPANKREARGHVVSWLAGGGTAWVRVNACVTPHYEPDIAAIAGLAGLRGVIVPKAEQPEVLEAVGGRLRPGTGIVALIETAVGIQRAYDIASCAAVSRLGFGAIDFAADIGAAEDDQALLLARSTLVLASRSARKPAPIDGVTKALDQPGLAAADATRAARLGFGGKFCLHPAQVAPVHEALRPTRDEIAWAREITAAVAQPGAAGAIRHAGQMIDKPVADRARHILARAGTGTDGATGEPSGASGGTPAVPALPLDGITVVALEQAVAAPFATRQLADLGARVIKVERPGDGDFARHYDQSVQGQASYFVWLNRGKESLELDIKSAGGQAVLAALLDRADVFVQNLAPGAADRAGLGAERLRERYPRLICCSVSGYGSTGPYRHKKAYDLLVQGEAGLLSVTGTPETPSKAGISVADIAAGMYAYSGVLTALYERERTGRGASFDVALLDALGEWMSQPYYYFVYGDQPPLRTGARHASISPYGPYAAAGGQVFLGLQNDREWAVFCERVLHRPDLITDQRFRANPGRVANNDQLTRIIEKALESVPADRVTAMLDDAGIASARLRTPAEFAAHPQLEARDRWHEVSSPGGPVRALRPPLSIDGREPAMGAIPALGQHTAAILAELGIADAATSPG
jgi:itaconate CoA-transferase